MKKRLKAKTSDLRNEENVMEFNTSLVDDDKAPLLFAQKNVKSILEQDTVKD